MPAQHKSHKPKARTAHSPKNPPITSVDPKSSTTTSAKKPLTFQPSASHFTPPPTRPRSQRTRITNYRNGALVVLGGLTLLTSSYITYVYKTYSREASILRDAGNTPPLDASARFNHIAEDYDANINTSEWLSGINNKRAKLLAKARGHVLEASVGTGRNAAFYPLTGGRIKSVTMVDQSAEMVRVARMNWAKTNAWFINAMFRIQSVAEPIPYPSNSPEGYDTVVQTMGVCSTGDPVAVLRNLGRLTKSDGRILLLEHGRAKYEWMNRVLDTIAPSHAERWGCWFNKDVGAVVRESGLEIVEERRYHFGTTWWFVLKPPRDRSILVDRQLDVGSAESRVEEEVRPWWAAWWAARWR